MHDKLRMMEWLAVTLVAMAVALLGLWYSGAAGDTVSGRIVAHASTGVWKLALISMGGYLGYLLDRTAAYYLRPDKPGISDLLRAAANQRRAIIVVGAMIAAAIGA